MTETEWLEATEPRPMVHHLGERVSERKSRLFVVATCRQVLGWFGERRSLHEIDTGERMADGLPEDAEMAADLAAEDERVRDAVRQGMPPSWANDGDIPLLQGVTKHCIGDVRWGMEDFLAAFEWCDAVRYPFDPGERVVENSMPARQCRLLRDIFGNPFRPIVFDPVWRWPEVVTLAAGMYESREFDRMPELAVALERAGCDVSEVLTHCREPGIHVRGCWVIDLILGRE